jgi:hypothetical protein
MSQTPPILHGPSEKERKYDRQLRLWAASGQAALESANLLLLNSGAGTVGVETLKNLVLPGTVSSLSGTSPHGYPRLTNPPDRHRPVYYC